MERHLGRMVRGAVAEHSQRISTRAQRGNGWVTKTYARLGHEIDALARVLIDHEVQPGDRVAIFAANRPEGGAVFTVMLPLRVPTPALTQ